MTVVKSLSILIVLLIPLFGIGQSAGIERPSAYDKLEQKFEVEEVSTQQLDAFEEKGMEKLNEFISYINLIADKDMDALFKEQAITMATDLFLSEEAVIKSYNPTTKKFESNPLKNYLQNLLSADHPLQVLSIEEIKTLDNAESDSYKWRLNFNQSISQGTEKLPKLVITMNVVLKKKIKYFGEEKKEVWEVLLSDMESINFAL